MSDPLRNPKDPLHKVLTVSDQELLRRMGALCDGFTHEHIINASASLLISAMRQAFSTRARAEAQFDEIMGRTKQALLNHYDSDGRKKGIFPYDQVIAPALFDARPKLKQ